MTLSFLLTVKFFFCYLLISFLWNTYWYRDDTNSSQITRNCSKPDGGGNSSGGGGYIPWPWLSDMIPSLIANHNDTIVEFNDTIVEFNDSCTDDENLIPITYIERELPCHAINNDERIVNGTPVGIGQRSYQVALFRRNNFACGGSFITRKFILTAAHCVRGYKANDLKIRYASRHYDSGPMMPVQDVYIHPEYNAASVENDIALLRLTNPLPKIPFVVDTAKLNNVNDTDLEVNQTVTVSGWGRTGRSLPTSKRLLMATLKIVDKQKCQEQWAQMFRVNPESMICASDSDKSACNGDSGGPLTDSDGKLIGIVSVGSTTCLSMKKPNVYTNVAYFHDWIQNTIHE